MPCCSCCPLGYYYCSIQTSAHTHTDRTKRDKVAVNSHRHVAAPLAFSASAPHALKDSPQRHLPPPVIKPVFRSVHLVTYQPVAAVEQQVLVLRVVQVRLQQSACNPALASLASPVPHSQNSKQTTISNTCVYDLECGDQSIALCSHVFRSQSHSLRLRLGSLPLLYHHHDHHHRKNR
jgi:hypothetical protein